MCVLHAEIYKIVYGDTLIPTAFVVPEAPPWPEHLMAMKLGKRLETFRTTDLYDEHADIGALLEKSGYDVRMLWLAPSGALTEVCSSVFFGHAD
jgi:hypothetical protein